MLRHSLTLALLLGATLAHAGDMPSPMRGRPGGQMPMPPSALYQASKQSTDPQATAQELFKSIPAAEANTRYEVMVSVRELPPPPLKRQPATAPLKGE